MEENKTLEDNIRLAVGDRILLINKEKYIRLAGFMTSITQAGITLSYENPATTKSNYCQEGSPGERSYRYNSGETITLIPQEKEAWTHLDIRGKIRAGLRSNIGDLVELISEDGEKNILGFNLGFDSEHLNISHQHPSSNPPSVYAIRYEYTRGNRTYNLKDFAHYRIVDLNKIVNVNKQTTQTDRSIPLLEIARSDKV